MEESKVLAKRIKELCAQQGMDYKQLAEACDEPSKRMYRIVSGMMNCQNILTLIKICKALNVSLDEFFDTEEFKEIL